MRYNEGDWINHKHVVDTIRKCFDIKYLYEKRGRHGPFFSEVSNTKDSNNSIINLSIIIIYYIIKILNIIAQSAKIFINEVIL